MKKSNALTTKFLYDNFDTILKFIDLIKVGVFIADGEGNVIMLNTIRMMHDIHKKLVVEGVETEDAKNAVSGMSCDYIQGFYFSKPLAEEDLIEFLRKNMQTANIS